MTDIEVWTKLLAWCTLANFVLLFLSAILVLAMRKTIARIHRRMFGLDRADLSAEYFRYLAYYKLLIIVFNLVPYLVLRLAF